MLRKSKRFGLSLCCRSSRVSSVVCGLTLLTPLVSNSAPWEFGIDTDIGIIYTDNVLLAPDGMEESEVVYSIVPEFYAQTDGDKLDVNLRYRPEAYFYSEFSDADDVFHVLDANLTATLVKERLFLTLNAANYQSIITPEGRFPTTNLPISANRIDSRTFEARPYWQQRLGQADMLLEASYSDVEYDSDLIQANDAITGRFKLDNIERQQGLAWGIEYQHRRIEYESSMAWEFQRASLDLGVWVNSGTRIFAVGGAETSITNIAEANLDEDFWEVGFQYRPNQRLNLELASGERSYGTSYRADFSFRLRRGNISVTYDEGPATLGENAFDYQPINDTDNLDNILDQPGSSDRFVRRRGEISTNLEFARSELTVRIFAEERELRSTADGMPLEDEEFSGAAVRWSWELGKKTTFGVDFDISERELTGNRDKLRRAQIDIGYRLTQRLSVNLAGMHSIQEGNVFGNTDYSENQVRLMLRTEL